jgi:hypothetical protein
MLHHNTGKISGTGVNTTRPPTNQATLAERECLEPSHQTTPNITGAETMAKNSPNWNMMASSKLLAGCVGDATIAKTQAIDHTAYRAPNTAKSTGFSVFARAEPAPGVVPATCPSSDSPQSNAGSSESAVIAV